MAKRFLTPLNLTNLASDPSTGTEGDLYFNTVSNTIKIYTNDVWTELQGGAGGASVIYTEEQPDTTELPVGTIWVDSDAEIVGGGSGGGSGGIGLNNWTENENGDLIPNVANIQSIGSSAFPVKEIYVSGSTIYLGETTLSIEDGELNIDGSKVITESNANENLDFTETINTASAAAFASASAYTDQQISTIDLSSTIQTASAAAVSYLVDGAPEALDTLNELAAALDDNANILDLYLTQSSASSTYATKINRWRKTYAASAQLIQGVDDNSNTLSYTAGYELFYLNGILLATNEYTTTSSSLITLNEALSINDVVDIVIGG
jgi:hypothetical protein